mmetsp:Transcript_119726/g.339340  ORF Transcript_119726/g.339340 Transcript_119726/m.339340 type:complete len:232 (-) Transcript_119726:143-838(-)
MTSRSFSGFFSSDGRRESSKRPSPLAASFLRKPAIFLSAALDVFFTATSHLRNICSMPLSSGAYSRAFCRSSRALSKLPKPSQWAVARRKSAFAFFSGGSTSSCASGTCLSPCSARVAVLTACVHCSVLRKHRERFRYSAARSSRTLSLAASSHLTSFSFSSDRSCMMASEYRPTACSCCCDWTILLPPSRFSRAILYNMSCSTECATPAPSNDVSKLPSCVSGCISKPRE